jgi:hypothetical protein
MLRLAARGANCLMLIWSAAQVQLAVPPLPSAVAPVFDDPLFPAAARTINHRCNYVTTYVSPQQGRAFHEPARPPCLLNLHGTVYHWLRSREGAAGSNAVIDANLAMEQWWTTPDSHEPDSATHRLVRSFRSGLLNCNPVTKELVRACQLSNRDPSQHIALRFQHGDAGPDVSAVYHTGSADRMPPHLQLCKWAAGSERPRCQPLRHGEADALSFGTLFPSTTGLYHQDLRLTTGKRLTRAQWARHLLFRKVPHIERQPRVFREFLLHVWNEVENERLQFFQRCIGPGEDDPDPTDAQAEGVDSVDCASFIPAAFTGGVLTLLACPCYLPHNLLLLYPPCITGQSASQCLRCCRPQIFQPQAKRHFNSGCKVWDQQRHILDDHCGEHVRSRATPGRGRLS